MENHKPAEDIMKSISENFSTFTRGYIGHIANDKTISSVEDGVKKRFLEILFKYDKYKSKVKFTIHDKYDGVLRVVPHNLFTGLLMTGLYSVDEIIPFIDVDSCEINFIKYEIQEDGLCVKVPRFVALKKKEDK